MPFPLLKHALITTVFLPAAFIIQTQTTIATSLRDQIESFIQDGKGFNKVSEEDKQQYSKACLEAQKALFADIKLGKGRLEALSERLKKEKKREKEGGNKNAKLSKDILQVLRHPPKLTAVTERTEKFNWRPYLPLLETFKQFSYHEAGTEKKLICVIEQEHLNLLQQQLNQQQAMASLKQQKALLDILQQHFIRLQQLTKKTFLYAEEEKEKDNLLERLKHTEDNEDKTDHLSTKIQTNTQELKKRQDEISQLEAEIQLTKQHLANNKKTLDTFDRTFRKLFVDKKKGFFLLLESIRDDPRQKLGGSSSYEQAVDQALQHTHISNTVSNFEASLKTTPQKSSFEKILSFTPEGYVLTLGDQKLTEQDLTFFNKKCSALKEALNTLHQDTLLQSFIQDGGYRLFFENNTILLKQLEAVPRFSVTVNDYEEICRSLSTTEEPLRALLDSPFLAKTQALIGYTLTLTEEGKVDFLAPSPFKMDKLQALHATLTKDNREKHQLLSVTSSLPEESVTTSLSESLIAETSESLIGEEKGDQTLTPDLSVSGFLFHSAIYVQNEPGIISVKPQPLIPLTSLIYEDYQPETPPQSEILTPLNQNDPGNSIPKPETPEKDTPQTHTWYSKIFG